MAEGFAEADMVLARLPGDVRSRLIDLLHRLGDETLRQQKAAVAKKTGYLEQGLTQEILIDQLRVHAGLLAFRQGRNSRYYGRFVEFGRRGRTKWVVRGTQSGKRTAAIRKRLAKGGSLRRAYALEISPAAPRPFVNLPGLAERTALRVAQFWSEQTFE